MVSRKLAQASLLSAILVALVPAIAAENVMIPTQDAGRELQLPGVLHKPSGDGPFAAVVMLCGCDGYADVQDAKQQSFWAEKLVQWGYVALQLDSFSPRGYPNGVCDNPGYVDSDTRSHDAFAAKSYLSALPFVDSKNIAVIGWSHGGWTVMAIIDGSLRDKGARSFKAAIAIYPWAETPVDPDTPLLVLIGAKDDDCPAARTEYLKAAYGKTKYELSLKIYPNARHSFDYDTFPPGGVDYQGHHYEYDPEATSNAVTQTRYFLAKYIGAK